jgi:uncharacterized protein with PQ loop repeat
MSCIVDPIIDYILGIAICIAGIVSYTPQYYSLITSSSEESREISEKSLFILNVGNACLAANSIILNWYKWDCYSNCNFWLCTAKMLPVIQITIGWIMVVPLYIIFIRLKVQNNRHRNRHCAFDLAYMLTYTLVIILILSISLGEKLNTNDPVGLSDVRTFFNVFSQFLGVASAVCACLVWIPQIIKLIKTKKQGSLSLLMFLLQAPGNLVIIFFQAIMYHQDWSTWFAYVITFVEQLIVVILILIYKYRTPNNVSVVVTEDSDMLLGNGNSEDDIKNSEDDITNSDDDITNQEPIWVKKSLNNPLGEEVNTVSHQIWSK